MSAVTTAEPADADLLRRAQEGDADSFGLLFERHAPSVMRLLLSPHLGLRHRVLVSGGEEIRAAFPVDVISEEGREGAEALRGFSCGPAVLAVAGLAGAGQNRNFVTHLTGAQRKSRRATQGRRGRRSSI